MLILIALVAVSLLWSIYEVHRLFSIEDPMLYRHRSPRIMYAAASTNLVMGVGLIVLGKLESFGSGFMLITLSIILVLGGRFIALLNRVER